MPRITELLATPHLLPTVFEVAATGCEMIAQLDIKAQQAKSANDLFNFFIFLNFIIVLLVATNLIYFFLKSSFSNHIFPIKWQVFSSFQPLLDFVRGRRILLPIIYREETPGQQNYLCRSGHIYNLLHIQVLP